MSSNGPLLGRIQGNDERRKTRKKAFATTTSSLDNKCSITATTGMKIGTNLCQHYNHNLLLPKKKQQQQQTNL